MPCLAGLGKPVPRRDCLTNCVVCDPYDELVWQLQAQNVSAAENMRTHPQRRFGGDCGVTEDGRRVSGSTTVATLAVTSCNLGGGLYVSTSPRPQTLSAPGTGYNRRQACCPVYYYEDVASRRERGVETNTVIGMTEVLDTSRPGPCGRSGMVMPSSMNNYQFMTSV